MITDCNLYSQTYVLEKKKKIIFINGYQLKHALHVSHFYFADYLNMTYKWNFLI